jgi:hypothetical protein
MTKTKHVAGAIMAAVILTTPWPIGDVSLEAACAEYNKVRAEFLKGEREFERQHGGYRPPVHAAIYRIFERPDAYLERVATKAHYVAYVQHRDDCARQLAAQRIGGRQ